MCDNSHITFVFQDANSDESRLYQNVPKFQSINKSAIAFTINQNKVVPTVTSNGRFFKLLLKLVGKFLLI